MMWLKGHNLLDGDEVRDMVFVCDGNWDLKSMMPKQCALSELEVPAVFQQWVDIRQVCPTPFPQCAMWNSCRHIHPASHCEGYPTAPPTPSAAAPHSQRQSPQTVNPGEPEQQSGREGGAFAQARLKHVLRNNQ